MEDKPRNEWLMLQLEATSFVLIEVVNNVKERLYRNAVAYHFVQPCRVCFWNEINRLRKIEIISARFRCQSTLMMRPPHKQSEQTYRRIDA